MMMMLLLRGCDDGLLPFWARKTRPVSWQGDLVKALNSKLVSAAMSASLFSLTLFKYSKSEPSITPLKNEALEKQEFDRKNEALEKRVIRRGSYDDYIWANQFGHGDDPFLSWRGNPKMSLVHKDWGRMLEPNGVFSIRLVCLFAHL
ncbi:hypothetical protein RDI58_007973 [Solanum bulbocastanum]|uniref:Uncharacterized protein n=1 Tax=Solanum bulbocastanum TaxID=147425 RepID=A0AAN8TVS3_SOLBU